MIQDISIYGLSLALGILAAVVWWMPERHPRHEPDPALIHPAPKESDMDITVWPTGWPHEAPDRPLSAAEAHSTMQRHRDCRRDECPRKFAAYQALVEAGHLVPDGARVR